MTDLVSKILSNKSQEDVTRLLEGNILHLHKYYIFYFYFTAIIIIYQKIVTIGIIKEKLREDKWFK